MGKAFRAKSHKMRTVPKSLHRSNLMTYAPWDLKIILDSFTASESGPRSFPNLCRPVVFGNVAHPGVRVIDGHIGVDQWGVEGEGVLSGFERVGTIEAALFTAISI